MKMEEMTITGCYLGNTNPDGVQLKYCNSVEYQKDKNGKVINKRYRCGLCGKEMRSDKGITIDFDILHLECLEFEA